MKKVLVGFFALLMVASAQAAALSWAGYGYNGDPALDASWYTGGQAYLLLVSDPGNFAVTDVGGTLVLTDASVVDSIGVFNGGVTGLLTASMSSGAQPYYALLMTTAGAPGSTLPTVGYYGVSPVTQMDAPWSTDTGSTWTMDGTFNGGNGVNVDLPIPVPEPASMALFGLGAGVLALRRRFKSKKTA